MSLRSPLGRVRGLGSAKDGTEHWWLQRVTALALIPLSIWFVIFMIQLVHADHNRVIRWIEYPVNAVLLILLLVCTFYHALLGLQVVIEDYVHSEGLKLATLLIVKFAVIVSAASAVFAVLKIAI